ncbi:MAG TPA: AAA family ATPase [Burkholderiaceae bacterium]
MHLQLAHHACVQAAGTTVALAPRDAALLAWLALEGPTARVRLASLLWPDSDPEAARNALRQRLFQLKKQLGVELVIGQAILALADGVHHDLEDSDSVLGDAAHAHGAEFDAWLAQQRERRTARTRSALMDLADMAERSHDHADALSHALELLALEPLSEAAHRRVMRLHYLRGDRAAALLAFDHCEQVLKNEVGARPSADTLALLATIDQSAASPGKAVSLLPGGARAVPASVQRPPRLIGRERAWSALHEAWTHNRCAVITGEAGMGKSRLASDFARARGATLTVSARPGDERVVYASFSRLLRELPGATLQTLDAPLRKELARLLPELGDAPALRSDADRTRFFNAVVAVLESPALALEGIVFDDLHFADDASIELLQYAAAGSRRHWLIAARSAEVSAPGRALLEGFIGQADTVCVALEPLTLQQVAELIDSLGIESLSGAEHAPALLRHTGGNPLYLLETVKAWLTQGGARLPSRLPAAVNLSHLIERRIGRLSAQAVQLARCAAIAAPDFSIELASRVLGLRTLDLADPWAELESAQVLCEGAFAHDLIYESALASVPKAVARKLHAEIAAFLQEHDGEPARLALHWAQAGQWPQAGAAYRAAAERARDASRLSEQSALLAEAARCFESAGRAAERFDALLQRARLLASNDLGSDASAAVAALEASAGTDEQRLLALDARLELAMTRYEIEEALRLGREAIVSARALGRADLELRFAIILSGALCDSREAAEAVALLEPYAPWVRAQAAVDQQWEYWEASALALDYADRLRDAMPAWGEARAVAERAGRRDMLWKTMSNTASTQAKQGLVREAAKAGAAARQLALASNDAVSMRVLQMQVTLAHRLRDLGVYGEALELLQGALAGYEAGGGSHSDKALTEQRLVVLFQQLGQAWRAQPLLAHERPGVPRGVAMIRLAHRAELEHLTGGDGLPLMREALQIVPNTDDIYHRITTLFATRLVPPDEGEAMAAGLAAWATTRERHGVALSGHVRAAACALALGAANRAWPHVEAALHLAKTYLPDSFYMPEMWLVAGQVLSAVGRAAEARRVVADGLAWVKQVHDQHVPGEFRDSFRQRNPVNRELFALAARWAAA